MNRPKRLSATFIKTVNRPGRYGDGRGGFGLSLLVKSTSSGRLSKTWSQRLRVNGEPCNIGLGAFPVVTLAEAREAALANRRAVAQGRDPRDRSGGVPTFAQALEKVIAVHEPNWRDGSRSADIWRSSLRDYAMPRLGRKLVDKITTADMLAVLVPIWSTKRETARRVRQRIGAVMQWAVAQGYREDNPAGDAIGAALPKTGSPKQHQRALPHPEVGEAVGKVRESKAWPSTKAAFEFLVLTAARSGEVRGARWEEISLEARTWDGSRRTHEVGPGAPGAPGSSSFGGANRGAGAHRGRRAGVPECAREGVVRYDPLKTDPRARYRGGSARVQKQFPGLGGGVLGRAERGLRAGIGARQQRPDRSGVSKERSVRSAPQADGGLGDVSGSLTPIRRFRRTIGFSPVFAGNGAFWKNIFYARARAGHTRAKKDPYLS